MLNIAEILDTIKNLEAFSKDAEIASIFKVRQSMITMWRKRGNIPYEILLHYCEERNIDPLWLLTGKGPKYRAELSHQSTLRNPKLNLMMDVIEAVEEVFERDRLSLSPEKKARLITLIFEEVSEDENKLTLVGQRVGKLIKLAS